MIIYIIIAIIVISVLSIVGYIVFVPSKPTILFNNYAVSENPKKTFAPTSTLYTPSPFALT